MAIMKVHGVPMSTCTARVLLCLYEKGLEFEFVQMDLANAAHKKEPHLSLNPFGVIPAFEDGDLTLFESRAIGRYLAKKHEELGPDLLRLDDIEESAIVDIWMEVEAHQYDRPMREVIHQIIVNPMIGKPTSDEIIKNEVAKLEKIFDVYERRLSNCRYLAGEHYTMADLNHIPYLVYFMRTDYSTLITSRPRLSSWWSDISSRPASVKVAEGLSVQKV